MSSSERLERLEGPITIRGSRIGGTTARGIFFKGRFKAILVERDAYLLELTRYVVLNQQIYLGDEEFVRMMQQKVTAADEMTIPRVQIARPHPHWP